MAETTYSDNSMLLLCVMLMVGILLHFGREGQRSLGTSFRRFSAQRFWP
jgi:hypothetical protein